MPDVDPNSEEALAFRRRIAASPDDDTPRLVFADWLDDRHPKGEDPYARYIRLRVAAAAQADKCNRYHNNLACSCDRCSAAMCEEVEFTRSPEFDTWFPIPAPRIHVFPRRRRGFVYAVETDLRWLFTHGDRYFELNPVVSVEVIDYLSLGVVGDPARRLLAGGYWGTARSVEIYHCPSFTPDMTEWVGTRTASPEAVSLVGTEWYTQRWPSVRTWRFGHGVGFNRFVAGG